jgi:hypothetical protein
MGEREQMGRKIAASKDPKDLRRKGLVTPTIMEDKRGAEGSALFPRQEPELFCPETKFSLIALVIGGEPSIGEEERETGTEEAEAEAEA